MLAVAARVRTCVAFPTLWGRSRGGAGGVGRVVRDARGPHSLGNTGAHSGKREEGLIHQRSQFCFPCSASACLSLPSAQGGKVGRYQGLGFVISFH